jgi:beta-lactamase class A
MLVALGAVCAAPLVTWAQARDAAAALRALEAREGGLLGVCVLDAKTGRVGGHRLDERFAMCSTFKLPLAAIVLREADRGRLDLDQVVHYTKQDLLSFAPVTSEHVHEGMTIAALAEAAQLTSDNTAANLLLAQLGGPAGFTARLRELGDPHTRLDRTEPQLNLVVAGDERDTTTPRAMAQTLATLLAGEALSASSRERLLAWMARTTTGTKRIRAGLPPDWRAGDKTGTGMAEGMTDKYNDIAITFPPGRGPLIITAFYDTDEHAAEMRDADQAVLAEVGRMAATW